MTEERRADPHDATPRNLAYAATALVAITVGALFFVPIPDGNKEVVYLVTGQIITGWLMAMGYYYSTTANAAAKDKLLARSTP